MEVVASLPRFPHPSQEEGLSAISTWSPLCSAGWVPLSDVDAQHGQGFLSQLECREA